MITVTIESKDSQSGERDVEHSSATAWEVDGHDGLHVHDGNGKVASYCPTRWLRVAKSDS